MLLLANQRLEGRRGRGHKPNAGNVQASLRAQQQVNRETVVRLKKMEIEKDEAVKTKERQVDLVKSTYKELCSAKEDIARLEQRTDELQEMDSLRKQVTSLQQTVNSKKSDIKQKNLEIFDYKKEIHKLEESIKQKDNSMAVVQERLKLEVGKDLEVKLSDAIYKLKIESLELDKYKEAVREQDQEISGLKAKLRKEKEKNVTLEHQQHAIKADLDASMQLISDKPAFHKSLLALQSRYCDANAKAMVHPKDPALAEIKILAQTVRTQMRTESMNQDAENKEMLDKERKEDQITSDYINTINDQRKAIWDLEGQLKKASKPAVQKVQSWIRKKVLRIPRVPEVFQEIPASRYDENQQVNSSPLKGGGAA